MESIRMFREKRKAALLSCALVLAETKGYKNLTGPKVASAAGLQSHGQINYYFGNIGNLRDIVLKEAVLRGNIEILLQGLVTKDPIALAAPEHLKNAAIDKLRNE